MVWVKKYHGCELCGSSDAASTNEDGWVTCFSCGERYPTDKPDYNSVITEEVRTMVVGDGIHKGVRGLDLDTVKRYGIRHRGDDVVFEYVSEDNGVVAQKVRRDGSGDDQFTEGEWSKGMLFGQHLFSKGGRFLTITEGEYDAASAYQMTGSKFPCVSIKNGARNALKDCKQAYEFIDSFDTVVIAFDSDEPGQKAAKEVAALFAGKSRIMKHHPDCKDANDYLRKGKKDDYVAAWWGAEVFTPDGIIAGSTLWDEVNQPVQQAYMEYPWAGLNELTYGIRLEELVTVTAGSGLGKSQFVRELIDHTLQSTDDNIGCIFLEESVRKTALSLMSLAANKPLHLPTTESTEAERKAAFNATLGTNRLFFYDHFGSTSVENIVGRVRYLNKAHDCNVVYLDHLSIIVSSQENGDERKAIDECMTKLRTLVQETGIALFLVSHLKRPASQGHEEGAATSLSQLRGSASIAQLSDMVLGLERNGQAEDMDERNTTYVRVLKNRFSGETGPACALRYDKGTGRMTEVDVVAEATAEGEAL